MPPKRDSKTGRFLPAAESVRLESEVGQPIPGPEFREFCDNMGLIIEDLQREVVEAATIDSHALSLPFEDIGWTRIGGVGTALQMPAFERRQIVERARLFTVRDPLTAQTMRLWRDFVIGRGITIKAQEDATQEAVDRFWNARRNHSVFGFLGIRDSADQINTDGEIAFAIFVRGQETTFRRLDPLQITGIVSDPEDSSTVLGYKREFIGKGTTHRRLFYWDAFLPAEEQRKERIPTGFDLATVKQGTTPVLIHFTAVNKLGDRGNSLLTASMDWSKAFRKFMEARHAIQQALAKFAWRHKVKGGSQAVADAVANFRSGLATGGSGNMDNPPPAPASAWVENQASNLEQMKTETGAPAAAVDGDMLLQMAGVGVGVFPHWYGSGKSAGNLSVASKMELPMLRQFRSAQELWRSIYGDLIAIALEAAGIGEDARGVDLIFPDIDEKDVLETVQAIKVAVETDPKLLDSDIVTVLLLTALGIKNPQSVIESLEADSQDPSAKVVRGLREITRELHGKEDVA